MRSDQACFKGTDRFLVRRYLGCGGFGVVYEAYDSKQNRLVALKSLRRFEPAAVYRFKQEFRALADLQHPNLVKLHELLSYGAEEWFFTMELIEGVNFLQHVCRNKVPMPTAAHESPTLCVARDAETDTLPLSTVSIPAYDEHRLRSALLQLAEGVFALHAAGKLHRDIKPSNVLVTKEGRVVLLDFGLVKELSTEGLPESMQVVGTPAYMSPEQAIGRSVSEASDWYSVGLILFEALTGRVPFRGQWLEIVTNKLGVEAPPPRNLAPSVPEDLDALCRDLLRRAPEARPSGQEVLARLRTSCPKFADSLVSRLSGTRPRTAAPFVGRETQLAALADAFRTMREGRTVTVFVHGSSGVGKSTLIRHFFEELRRDKSDAALLAGRCYEQESVPYKGFDSLMDALSRYLQGLSAVELERLMPRDVLTLARLFPVLRQVPAVTETRRRVLEIQDNQELRRRAFAALRELLGRLADQKPLVLFIDDLQWGDLDSASLLEEILKPQDPPALLLIACYRTEEAETSPLVRALLRFRAGGSAAVDVRELELKELSESEATDLVLSLAADDQVVSERAEAIAHESGGNPFFVNELVRCGAPNQTPVTTLDDVIQSRVCRLPTPSRRLLEVLAVAGRPLEVSICTKAADVQTEEWASALDLLRAEHLVRPRGTDDSEEFEIYHARIGETVVAHLSEEALKRYHRGVAVSLEGFQGADPEDLYAHFYRAGELAPAAYYAALAARQASDALAFDRAARLYRIALELQTSDQAARQVLRVELGATLANAGRCDESALAYLLAAESEPTHEKIELQRRAAEQFLRGGHIDQGLAALRAVLTSLRMKMPKTVQVALLWLVLRRIQARLRGLKFRERDAASISAEELLRLDACWSVAVGLGMVDSIRGAYFQVRHLLFALRAGEPYRVARALALEISYCANAGGRATFRTARLARETLALAERLNDPYVIGLVQLTSGLAAYLEGKWKQAVELCERSEVLLREHCTGISQELDSGHHFQLRSLYWLGELKELSHRLPTLIKEAEERGDLYGVTMLAIRNLYVVRLAEDNVLRAREETRRAIERWSQQGFHNQHYVYLVAQTEMDLYSGDGEVAWHRIIEGWKDLARSLLLRVQFAFLEATHLRARCALAAAAVTGDRGLLRSAENDAYRMEREKMRWSDALAKTIRAGIASLRGNKEIATELLAAAEDELEAADMRLCGAVARRRRGELVGGEAGQQLIDAADHWMIAQGVQNPVRFAVMLLPGL